MIDRLKCIPKIHGYPVIRPRSLRFAIWEHHSKLFLQHKVTLRKSMLAKRKWSKNTQKELVTKKLLEKFTLAKVFCYFTTLLN